MVKNFFHLHSSSTSCSEMVGQGHFCKPIKIFGRSYLPFINGGTTLNNRSLLTSMTVCIESCGTGDISSSIGVAGEFQFRVQYSAKVFIITHFLHVGVIDGEEQNRQGCLCSLRW